MGLSTRPIKIEPAIIMPALMSPWITSRAPSPNTSDCRHKRKVLLTEPITAPVSLALFCSAKNRECSSNQRLRNTPSIPMA